MSTLRGSRLSVDFLGLRALDNVSIEVRKGEILGLIGPNGSGKTTLVNVLCGQIAPSSGQMFCNESEITFLPPHRIAKKGIARSFQIVRVFSHLTVRENIEVAGIAHGVSRHTARLTANNLLAELGLNLISEDLAGVLSYGDKRRVEIARGLASSPEFLLLDEPAAGMNEQETASLLAYLRELPEKRNLGLLVIDHDMPLIMQLCQRLHVLASGKTIAEGDTASVSNAPQVIEAYLGSSYEKHKDLIDA